MSISLGESREIFGVLYGAIILHEILMYFFEIYKKFYLWHSLIRGASLVAQLVKNLPAVQET